MGWSDGIFVVGGPEEGEMTWFYECVGIVVATLLLAGYIIFG